MKELNDLPEIPKGYARVIVDYPVDTTEDWEPTGSAFLSKETLGIFVNDEPVYLPARGHVRGTLIRSEELEK